MNWQRLDLNLLKVLKALLDEGSVTRAAHRLHISPSAVSHALARLRRTFKDPLFVRVGSRITATSSRPATRAGASRTAPDRSQDHRELDAEIAPAQQP